MNGILRETRHAVRMLVGTPGFTLAALLTLALGIGANIAMFSVVYGVLLRPLPYRDADRLVLLRAEAEIAGGRRPLPIAIQSNEIDSWQRPLDAIAQTAFFTPSDVVAMSGENGSEVLSSAVVSPTFFSTIAGPLAAGRAIETSDAASPVAVISERLAARLFGGADGAVGRQLSLSRGVLTVVGVASRAFQFPSPDVDVWMSSRFVDAAGRASSLQVIARLEPGGTAERARAAVVPMFEESTGGKKQDPDAIRTTAVSVSDEMVSAVRPALLVLFASVLMVLLVACGNLINLMLARNSAREKEFAVRRALGASAPRLIRQLLVESAILGVAGTIGGVLLARVSLTGLARFAGDALPRIDAVHLDAPALVFAAGLALLATVLTGIMPALKAIKSSPMTQQNSGTTATPRAARRLQRSMCVVQVAFAVMLLVGAALMGRSLVRLLDVDLGVSTDHVLTASLNLMFGGRPPDAETIARIDRVIEQVRSLPGVRAVGAGTGLPPSVSRMMVTLRRRGDTIDYRAAAVPATPGYFSALQMRLVKGRFFTETDDGRHPPVIIMSEDTAKRFFDMDDPIGQTLTLPVVRNRKTSNEEMTLVGITANVKYAGLAAPPDDVVYRPFAQQPWVAPFLIVRTTGDPAAFGQTLRRAIAAADPGIVVGSVATLDQLVHNETAQPQFRTVLLAAMAALAMGIAAIGLYGVVAYAVSRRTKEIGIRLALGATSREVLSMVLADGLMVAVIGIAAGTVGAWMLSRLVAALLYGITPTDPVSYGLAAAGLFILTLVASYIPARRASRVDPVGALRTE